MSALKEVAGGGDTREGAIVSPGADGGGSNASDQGTLQAAAGAPPAWREPFRPFEHWADLDETDDASETYEHYLHAGKSEIGDDLVAACELLGYRVLRYDRFAIVLTPYTDADRRTVEKVATDFGALYDGGGMRLAP